MIDAHHHLWSLNEVHYPWLMAEGVKRFFGDPSPIQRDYLMSEFHAEASTEGFKASVHIQVGAEDSLVEAKWIQNIADQHPDWSMAQVVFCDLISPDLTTQLDKFKGLSSVRGIRQIVARAPEEDKITGTNALLENPRFINGIAELGSRDLSFDLQLTPDVMEDTAKVLSQTPETRVALCHAGSPYDRSRIGINEWSDKLTHLSRLPNVFCKLSGLGMFDHQWTQESISPIVEICLEQFGAERCMFGSNFPVDKLYSDYQTVVAAYKSMIPNDIHAQFFDVTAKRFYKF